MVLDGLSYPRTAHHHLVRPVHQEGRSLVDDGPTTLQRREAHDALQHGPNGHQLVFRLCG